VILARSLCLHARTTLHAHSDKRSNGGAAWNVPLDTSDVSLVAYDTTRGRSDASSMCVPACAGEARCGSESQFLPASPPPYHQVAPLPATAVTEVLFRTAPVELEVCEPPNTNAPSDVWSVQRTPHDAPPLEPRNSTQTLLTLAATAT
jgi:hypothetical protein